MKTPLMHIENLSVGYGAYTVLSDLSLQLYPGELTALLGPNGSGKSTLIRTISGVQKALDGHVEINQKPIAQLASKEIAKKLSLVLTADQTPGNLTVYALVALGRFPYTSWIGALSQEDEKIIHWAMEMTNISHFANRHIGSLSDGERQKVMIARALAQQTEIIILDEPTAHLDTPNRLEIFNLLRDLAATSGKAILVSSHDIDTALHYADRMWLVNQTSIAAGIPEDLVVSGALEQSFARESLQFDYAKGVFFKDAEKTKRPIKLTGEPILVKWVQNALEREGYVIEDKAAIEVSAQGKRGKPQYIIAGKETTYITIEELINDLRNKDK